MKTKIKNIKRVKEKPIDLNLYENNEVEFLDIKPRKNIKKKIKVKLK